MRWRWAVAGGVAIAVTMAGGATWWTTRHRAVLGNVTVDPGPLVVGSLPPAKGARSAGCGKATERAKGTDLAAGGRHFSLWGPASGTEAKPIVLAFHGWGSNGRQFQQWFEMEKRVEDEAYVVYPDADGPNWDYTGDKDIRFVIAMVEEVAASYCVDTSRVLAVGFSYGGRFVNHLGCRAPALVRGIVIAGSRWDAEETTCVAPIPVLVTHRTRDTTMPIAGGREAAERWAKLERCTGTQPISNGCLAWTGCEAGAVTFCEDRHYDPEWPRSWNHTMRESYELLAWRWFEQLR